MSGMLNEETTQRFSFFRGAGRHPISPAPNVWRFDLRLPWHAVLSLSTVLESLTNRTINPLEDWVALIGERFECLPSVFVGTGGIG